MGPFRKLLLVGVGVFALHSVQACTTETELNPQPLPPETGEPPRSPQDSANDGKSSGTTGGGATPPPAPAAADAGTEGGDASDGGDG